MKSEFQERESASTYSASDWDLDLVGTHFAKSSLQPDSDVKGSKSDDGDTPYELTPDEIDAVIVAPTPKPKRPLAGWAIELVPGDKTTAVTPREYAQREPKEFAAQYPQYVKFL
ncbi:hypothetical protein B0H11DRAFT_2254083 [Mycena galericulata]|nr:hypothetical protein B0H11DRAFT_2254083 [Mycena galericulata]